MDEYAHIAIAMARSWNKWKEKKEHRGDDKDKGIVLVINLPLKS